MHTVDNPDMRVFSRPPAAVAVTTPSNVAMVAALAAASFAALAGAAQAQDLGFTTTVPLTWSDARDGEWAPRLDTGVTLQRQTRVALGDAKAQRSFGVDAHAQVGLTRTWNAGDVMLGQAALSGRISGGQTQATDAPGPRHRFAHSFGLLATRDIRDDSDGTGPTTLKVGYGLARSGEFSPSGAAEETGNSAGVATTTRQWSIGAVVPLNPHDQVSVQTQRKRTVELQQWPVSQSALLKAGADVPDLLQALSGQARVVLRFEATNDAAWKGQRTRDDGSTGAGLSAQTQLLGVVTFQRTASGWQAEVVRDTNSTRNIKLDGSSDSATISVENQRGQRTQEQVTLAFNNLNQPDEAKVLAALLRGDLSEAATLAGQPFTTHTTEQRSLNTSMQLPFRSPVGMQLAGSSETLPVNDARITGDAWRAGSPHVWRAYSGQFGGNITLTSHLPLSLSGQMASSWRGIFAPEGDHVAGAPDQTLGRLRDPAQFRLEPAGTEVEVTLTREGTAALQLQPWATPDGTLTAELAASFKAGHTGTLLVKRLGDSQVEVRLSTAPQQSAQLGINVGVGPRPLAPHIGGVAAQMAQVARPFLQARASVSVGSEHAQPASVALVLDLAKAADAARYAELLGSRGSDVLKKDPCAIPGATGEKSTTETVTRPQISFTWAERSLWSYAHVTTRQTQRQATRTADEAACTTQRSTQIEETRATSQTGSSLSVASTQRRTEALGSVGPAPQGQTLTATFKGRFAKDAPYQVRGLIEVAENAGLQTEQARHEVNAAWYDDTPRANIAYTIDAVLMPEVLINTQLDAEQWWRAAARAEHLLTDKSSEWLLVENAETVMAAVQAWRLAEVNGDGRSNDINVAFYQQFGRNLFEVAALVEGLSALQAWQTRAQNDNTPDALARLHDLVRSDPTLWLALLREVNPKAVSLEHVHLEDGVRIFDWRTDGLP